MASCAAGEKAVYRILLIHKDFEHCIELCQYIQAPMLDMEAGQLQRARGTKGRFRVARFRLSSQVGNSNPLFFAVSEALIQKPIRSAF